MTDYLLNKARRSLGGFCQTECLAYCCRKGQLNLSQKQMNKVVGSEKSALKKLGRLTLKDKHWSLNLKGDCPSLKQNQCTIHSSTLRPQACSDYPLFVKEENGQKFVFASPSCPGVQAGKLYPYMRRLSQEGYIIIEATNIVSLNLQTFQK